MLTLYDFRNSVCCQKVRITMRAKGLAWDAVKVDLFKTEQYDPKYLSLNPKRVVPTLVHDGKQVFESTLICEYIDETFPQPPHLIPTDPWLQSRMRLWSKACRLSLAVWSAPTSESIRQRRIFLSKPSHRPIGSDHQHANGRSFVAVKLKGVLGEHYRRSSRLARYRMQLGPQFLRSPRSASHTTTRCFHA
jgi:glutathione S-transferase